MERCQTVRQQAALESALQCQGFVLINACQPDVLGSVRAVESALAYLIKVQTFMVRIVLLDILRMKCGGVHAASSGASAIVALDEKLSGVRLGARFFGLAPF